MLCEILTCIVNVSSQKARQRIPEGKELRDEHIRALILDFGGTSMDIMNDKELSQQYLPSLMADAHIARDYM